MYKIYVCLFFFYLQSTQIFAADNSFDAFICISSEDEKYNVKGGIGTYLGILTKEVKSLYPDIEVYWITKSHNALDFFEIDEFGVQRSYLSETSSCQTRPFYSNLEVSQNEDNALMAQQIFLNKANHRLGALLETLQGKKVVIECAEWEGIAHQIYRTVNNKNTLKATRIHTPLAVTMLSNCLPLSTVNKLQLLHEFEVLNYSDCISSCSNYMKEETITHVLGVNNPRAEIKVIPNPIDSKNYKPGVHQRSESLILINDILKKEFVSKETYNIYIIGSVETRKGAELVTRAVAEVALQIPNARFCFFGHHGGGDSKTLTANTKISPNELYEQIPIIYHHQVAFAGYVDHSKLACVIESGDVFPIMYLGDNFPGTVAEIALMEKPILALERGGLKEMLQNEKGEMIAYNLGASLENAPIELAKGLLLLYQNKKQRDQIGYDLRNMMLSKYQQEKVTTDIVNYYRACLQKKNEGLNTGRDLDEKALVCAIEQELDTSPVKLTPSIHGGDNKVFILKRDQEIIGVAKCYTKRNNNQVKNIYDISQKLAERLPVPPMRRLFLFEESIPIIIQDFVYGEHIKKLNHVQIENVVSLMTKIHQMDVSNHVLDNNEFNYEDLLNSVTTFCGLEDVKEIYSSIDRNYLDKIPCSLIHGDVSLSNLLFVEDSVVALLDLDHVRLSYRLTDLARTQVFFSFSEDGELNEHEVVSFVEKYDRESPLTHGELNNFYHHMKLLLIKMALETYYYVEVRKEVSPEIFKNSSFNQPWELLLKKLYCIRDKSSL